MGVNVIHVTLSGHVVRQSAGNFIPVIAGAVKGRQ
jgi:hypothetical protein